MGMLPLRRIGKAVFNPTSQRAAIMCVAALSFLWARTSPPSLPDVSPMAGFHLRVDHGHRLTFNHENSQWAAAPSAPSLTPPPVAAAQFSHGADTLIQFVTDGWHYNRPPPIR